MEKTGMIARGEVRFMLMYLDPHFRIPIITTMQFIEASVDEHGQKTYLFSNADPDKDETHVIKEADLAGLALDLDALMETLQDA